MRQLNPKTDLTGRRFGLLTVTGPTEERRGGCILWRCRCDCGGEILATRQMLVSGNAVSCGCVPPSHASKGEAEDLTGLQFGELTVLRRAENDAASRVCWVCRCSCGKEVLVKAAQLKSGHTRSCGCKKNSVSYNRHDVTGQRFGRLVALEPSKRENRFQKGMWRCRCDCGREVDVYLGSLLSGATQSCGCLNRETSKKIHDHMHYGNDTCVERLVRAQKDYGENKAGFRGLFLTKKGFYRVSITFRKVHYTLGYYQNFDDAVKVRLNAEERLHKGYVEAYTRYEELAKADPKWAEENPFFYSVMRVNGDFQVQTNAG